MKVWRLLTDNRNMEVEIEQDEIFDQLMDSKGAFINEWKIPRVKVSKKGRYQDMPYLSGGNVVFNSRSLNVLEGLLRANVQLLDVDIINADIQLKIAHISVLDDAVDYTRSIPKRSLGGIVNGFNKIAFSEGIVSSRTIFKIRELSTPVFVSDQFREIVLQSKLKGFEFIEVWDSEITEEMEVANQERYDAFLEEIEKRKGPEVNWSEAVVSIEGGKAVASGHWKMQYDKNGEMRIARLSLDCQYNWSRSPIIPPVLLGLRWHEVEKSDL